MNRRKKKKGISVEIPMPMEKEDIYDHDVKKNAYFNNTFSGNIRRI